MFVTETSAIVGAQREAPMSNKDFTKLMIAMTDRKCLLLKRNSMNCLTEKFKLKKYYCKIKFIN